MEKEEEEEESQLEEALGKMDIHEGNFEKEENQEDDKDEEK